MTEHWHRLPKAYGVSSLVTFKILMDVVLGTLQCLCYRKGLDQTISQSSFQPDHSVKALSFSPALPGNLSCSSLTWLFYSNQLPKAKGWTKTSEELVSTGLVFFTGITKQLGTDPCCLEGVYATTLPLRDPMGASQGWQPLVFTRDCQSASTWNKYTA